MATFTGVVRTLIDAGTGGPKRADLGNLIFQTDTYEATGEAIASVLKLGKILPTNSSAVEVILAFDALGASSTLAVGDATDPDRYITATSSSSAGVVRINAISGLNFLNTAATDILITTAGGTITGTIAMTVIYTA